MNIITIASFLSTFLALVCVIPYVIAIIQGRTKPHKLTWIIFVIMNGIVLFSQYFEGGRESIYISLAYFVGSIIILLLSIKSGISESSKWDKSLFIFALITIVIWYFTKSNSLALWLTLVIDVLGTSMTILKIKADPYSEDPIPWIIATVAYIFSCLTLIHTPLGILYVRPYYGLLCDALLVFCIYFFQRKKLRVKNR